MNNTPDFVLDCSVTMAWCFEDEMTDYSESVFTSLTETKALAPLLWSLEVANVLLYAQRKKRINKVKAAEFNDALHLLPIQIDHTAGYKSFISIMTLAEETGLTIYDATYLELALQYNLPIATLDKSVKKAAQQMKVPLYLQNA